MFRVCAIFLTLGVLFSVNQALPRFKSDIKSCYKQACPEDTFACEKISRVSKDRKHIIEEIHCLGLNDDILKNATTTSPNPFGPTMVFQSYSYSGTYEVINTNVDSDESESNKNTNNKEIEEADTNHIEKSSPKPNRREHSEVDDLNGSPEVL